MNISLLHKIPGPLLKPRRLCKRSAAKYYSRVLPLNLHPGNDLFPLISPFDHADIQARAESQ
jgi:hypothetical protein